MSDLLNLRSVGSGYGKSQILWEIAFDVKPGEAATVLGRNGVGKTTLLKTIMGQLPVNDGHVYWNGHEVTAASAHERARLGIGYVPQGRHVFPHLTVTENLEVGLSALDRKRYDGKREIPEIVYELFPKLGTIAGRKAGVLSGGEQQQLAIGRALSGRPSMLLLDEPTEGIQPNIVQQIEDALVRVRTELNMAVLIVEQNLDFAWRFADSFYVLQRGRIVSQGKTAEHEVDNVEHLVHV